MFVQIGYKSGGIYDEYIKFKYYNSIEDIIFGLKIYTLFMIIILTYGVRFISAYNIISKGIDD